MKDYVAVTEKSLLHQASDYELQIDDNRKWYFKYNNKTFPIIGTEVEKGKGFAAIPVGMNDQWYFRDKIIVYQNSRGFARTEDKIKDVEELKNPDTAPVIPIKRDSSEFSYQPAYK